MGLCFFSCSAPFTQPTRPPVLRWIAHLVRCNCDKELLFGVRVPFWLTPGCYLNKTLLRLTHGFCVIFFMILTKPVPFLNFARFFPASAKYRFFPRESSVFPVGPCVSASGLTPTLLTFEFASIFPLFLELAPHLLFTK